ncbi:hypothetical protein [Olsenella sp. An290]|uniref:hypothetical protein n=1 Tax=Olsenella sp. An290 TaxID=1965625 RepID=UPI000B39D5B9|nr:hypothetical protein [Olsenella sp. An290]
MRIAIAQMTSHAGDFSATAARMAEQSRRAAERGVDLLVFPAPVLCGAAPAAPADREGFLLDLAGCLMGLVDELACPCLVPVLADVGGATLPEALLFSEGGVVPVRLAAYLEAARARARAEEGADAPGEPEGRPLPEVEFAGARLGVAFTYEDLDDYDDYEYDVDVIVFLSGYGFATDDVSSALGSSLADGRFLADAEATGAWIVGVGALGSYDAQVFCGSSFVLAPWGELAAQAPSLEEALLVCDLDPSAEGPLAEALPLEVFDAPLMAWGALSLGVEAVCEGGRDACVVVDGRLPSLLVATLATDALGPTRVRALVPRTGDASLDAAAEALVRSLRLPEGNVERVDLVAEAEKDQALAHDLAEARLASLARRTGAVALGSVDKTALALGGAPDVCAAAVQPLGDLYRSDVVALARLRNTISPVISEAALATGSTLPVEGLEVDLPSAEARLEFVDLVLSSYLEWETPISDIAAERGHAAAIEAIATRVHDADALRGGAGRPIVVSSRTIGEARGPIGLAWRDRVRPDVERAASEVAEALARMSAVTIGEGAPEQAPDVAARAVEELEREREVRDLLGYLRDFAQDGGFSSLGGAADPEPPGAPGDGAGPDAPRPLWDGPFSEN